MKKLFFLALGLIALNATAQSVSINTDGSTAHPSALLEVKSENQGVLIPRMTEAQRILIASPATGLMIYQTDATAGFYFYNGSAWTSLSGATGPQGPAGVPGAPGLQGPAGVPGANGQGVPTGGAANQVLAKVDGTDFNTAWVTPSGGGSSSYKGIVLDVAQTTSGHSIGVGTGVNNYTSAPIFLTSDVITPPPSSVGTFVGACNWTYCGGSALGLNLAVQTNADSPTTTNSHAFTAIEPGYYQVNCEIVGIGTSSTSPSFQPIIVVNSPGAVFKQVVFGTVNASLNTFSNNTRSRGMVSSVVKLNAGDYVGIVIQNLSNSVTGIVSSDGTTRLTIVKL